jgi:hypothetical protein
VRSTGIWASHDSGLVHQFPAGGFGRHRLLVRPDAGHRVVGVGDAHHPTRQRDGVARLADRVPGAVEVLVVVGDPTRPLPEPAQQRGAHLQPETRVVAHRLPLDLVEGIRLVQDLRRHPQLPDVVEEGRPSQLGASGGAQVHLRGEQIGVGPNPLGMAPGAPVVERQGGGQLQDQLRRTRPLVLPEAQGLVVHLLDVLDRAAGAEGAAKARRGVVREHRGHPQQEDQGEDPFRQALGHHQHQGS